MDKDIQEFFKVLPQEVPFWYEIFYGLNYATELLQNKYIINKNCSYFQNIKVKIHQKLFFI